MMMAKKKDDNKKEELELQLTEAQQLFCRLYVLGTMSNKECYLTAFKIVVLRVLKQIVVDC